MDSAGPHKFGAAISRRCGLLPTNPKSVESKSDAQKIPLGLGMIRNRSVAITAMANLAAQSAALSSISAAPGSCCRKAQARRKFAIEPSSWSSRTLKVTASFSQHFRE